MKHDLKKIIRPFDERRDLAIPGNQEESVEFAVRHFLEIAKSAIAKRDCFTVALAGGSTPKAIYRQLVKSKEIDEIDWGKVLVFWSDERCVPHTHSDSNFKMAMENGIGKLPIPEKNIFPMPGEGDPEANAEAYEKSIQKHVPYQVFDLVMLGMGDDGHTASLFPKTHGLHPNSRLVIANFVPQKDVWRLSFTFDCINEARLSVFYVMGASKAKMVQRVLAGPYDPDSYPAQRVGTPAHRALWVLDNESSSQLQVKAN
jgi:6-phosphogluconolactonase